jgi:ATP-dependent helicase/nuclease subunit A
VAPTALDELRHDPAVAELRRLCEPAAAKSAHLAARLSELAAAIDCLASAHASSCAQLLADIVRQARVTDIRGAKHWNNVDDYEPFKDACERVRDLLKGCALNEPPNFADARDAAALGLALLRLVADVNATLETTKASRNQLEFDDLLALAQRLLMDPAHAAIRKQVQRSTRLLMVDEFQDTNPLQVEIIKAFTGDDWREQGLFTVGDLKQSIYRFNGAEPAVSTRLRLDLPAEGRLSLTRNFRSQPGITDFVNAIFHDVFHEYEPLVPARSQATAAPIVEFLWTPDAAAADNNLVAEAANAEASVKKRRRAGATHDARALEARWIARRLVQLLKSSQPLVVDRDGTPRPLRLGDIAVLLRTLSDAQVYEEAFRDHGLDYYLAGGHAFYSQQEVYDILNLLRAVASVVDEIALAGALRSPLFSLADETLFWLVEKHGSLNAALAASAPPGNLSPTEAAKVRRASDTMARLRVEKDRLLVAELLTLALELTGYDAILLTEFLGPRKAANIEKLLEQARTLDRSSPGDLQGFITQLSEFVVRAPKEALAATQAEGDVIRIMTIHYAKGLEFPLVVLPDLDRQRNPGSWQPVLDLKLGPLMPLDAEEKQGCIGLDLYRHVENIEDLEERKRLLYVACTRAADYLILSSSMEDPSRPKRDWLQLIDRRINLVDGSLRGALPLGYAAPQIRVITEKPRIDDETITVSRGADLKRLVVKTRELAAKSPGEVPHSCDAVPVDAGARRRFSFSQLSGELVVESSAAATADILLEEVPDEDLIPSEQHSSLELGLLVHAVLQRLDIRKRSGVRELCESLAPRYVDQEPGAIVAEATSLIERFLRTPRAAELAAANVVRREIDFLLPWPLEGDGPIRYLHGYIDCLYQDREGRWRMLDYKTNRVTSADVPSLAERYEPQMLVYALVCEQALGEPLAECSLQVLHAAAEYNFQWDAAARRQGVQRISDAIRSLLRA